ncbi:MAG: MBOAT family protein [Lachnospiraceae bacterium]|nr:MBOAT family protein [Lachnospiraceae bacterium]
MSIKSLTFLAFVLVVFCIYYAVQKTDFQKLVLLTAGIICMVSMSSIAATGIVVILALCVYGIAIRIETLIKESRGTISRAVKGWLMLAIVLDIGLLLYFKFFKNTYLLLQNILAAKNIMLAELVVPIGLSYYTLALYGYLMDIYHKKYPAEKDFFLFLTYVTYFPAIIEGPVNLYKKVAPQFRERHFFDGQKVVMGLQRCLWGYFKKVVIADRIGILVMGILQEDTAVGPLLLYAMVLYSFQIYTDFSGGIDVIMGISEMLDIKLTENFKSPLISSSVTEYWARWHISLGEFMEKYIYYPIALNKNVMKFSKKISNKYLSKAFSSALASFIVFIVVGIWHGTGWNYVVYGLYQAVFVAGAVLLMPFYKKIKSMLHIDDKTLSWKIFTVFRTFSILVFGRILIKCADLQGVGIFLQKLFADINPHALFDGTIYQFGLDYKNVYLMYACILLVIVVDILHEKGVHFRELLMRQGIVFRYIVYYIAVFSIVVFGIYGAEFHSANFIYQAF